MKKLLLFIFSTSMAIVVYGQWTPIPIGNTTTEPTSMSGVADSVVVSFAGDGIFKTLDLGNSWVDVSGDLPNKYVNEVLPGPGPMLFVSTNDGPYYTMDQSSYTLASTGLDNTDVSFYYIGGDLDDKDFIVGTNGGGFYTGPGLVGPWSAANNGLTNDALNTNVIGGYDFGDSSRFILGTNAGVYYSDDNFSQWTSGNNGLSGDQLIITGVLQLSTMSFITTHAGCYYSIDKGASWVTLIADEKFNLLVLKINPGGDFVIFVLGETSYLTSDLANFTPISTPGEVICGTVTTNDLLIATASGKSDVNFSGGFYRQPIDWIISGLPDNTPDSEFSSLQQNYPNPFGSSTTIGYTINKSDFVQLKVLDCSGREITTLVNEFQDEGSYQVVFDATDCPAGIYYYTLQTRNNLSKTKLMINLK
jgi:hypothetical protein